MRTALVTGGAGFIGSHVARCLLEDGFDVTVLDSLATGTRERVPDGARLHLGDIRSEESARLVRESGFDVICHLAAQIDVRRSVADPLFDSDVNVRGTINLLEAVRGSGSPTRFVFSSTGGAIYGDGAALPTPETAEKAPQSPYGTSKLAAEYYLSYFARVHGVDGVVLRYSNVFGPAQDGNGEAGVVAIFCDRILSGEPLTVYGDGLQTRDYVYVGDVARANLLAATRPLPAAGGLEARVYNVGTGSETSVLELIAQLAGVAGEDVRVSHAAERLGEQRRSAIAVERARAALGWEPRFDLRQGLAETYAWFARKRAAGALATA